MFGVKVRHIAPSALTRTLVRVSLHIIAHRSVSIVSSNYALLYERLIFMRSRRKGTIASVFRARRSVRQVYRINSTENCILRVYNAHASHAVLTMAFSVMRAYYYTHIMITE